MHALLHEKRWPTKRYYRMTRVPLRGGLFPGARSCLRGPKSLMSKLHKK